jgi:hypothetical protein
MKQEISICLVISPTVNNVLFFALSHACEILIHHFYLFYGMRDACHFPWIVIPV